MEDRYPILDILEQTPDLPETAQWALFLRNHDELTLEMVTDEERDYMYRVYAADPQARINLGIRRRLAPLLGNDRRRLELMNGLLFSLPGTPVIYYGDEIGMGDNVYLGDRNGVRTPMQWSSDRNAGFSTADRQRLYLPVITDAEYHYEAVNVDAQQSNPQSLLWWMKRLIALRKRHPAFGRGSLRFLHPGNRRILAFIREDGDETLLVVANLSRYAQWTELALAAYDGRVPVELFGAVEFPRIGSEPYLRQPRTALVPVVPARPRPGWPARARHGMRAALPELALAWRPGAAAAQPGRPGSPTCCCAGCATQALVPRRRAGRAGGPHRGCPWPSPPTRRSSLAAVEVRYRHAEPVTYLVPLTTRREPDAGEAVADETEPRRGGPADGRRRGRAAARRQPGAGRLRGPAQLVVGPAPGPHAAGRARGPARRRAAAHGTPATSGAPRAGHPRAALHVQQPGLVRRPAGPEALPGARGRAQPGPRAGPLPGSAAGSHACPTCSARSS